MISAFGATREKDGGSLRALCQALPASNEGKEAKTACVLVTIYRRESDLFALLLRERHDSTAGEKAGMSVLCDMTLDDGVHLEQHPSNPLAVKVVNTCGDMRYLLEFGRAVDLTTFESAFTAAKGYFRQMLTLRTLVADSFWQGFSAGAGAPARSEPHGSPSKALTLPPATAEGAGQPACGLRGKETGRGAGGADPEELAAEIGVWQSETPATGGGSASSAGISSPRPNARPSSVSLAPKLARSKSLGASGASGDDSSSSLASIAAQWGAGVNAGASGYGAGGSSDCKRLPRSPSDIMWPVTKGPVDKVANKKYNRQWVDVERSCHRCHYGSERKKERSSTCYACPNGKPHAFCVTCVFNVWSIGDRPFKEGLLRWACPICANICPCPRCGRNKGDKKVVDKKAVSSTSSSTTAVNVKEKEVEPEPAPTPAPPVGALAKYVPAPKLTHYQGLFTKYMQSLPALERLPLTEDVCFLCKEGGDLVECDEGTSWSRKVKAKHASLGNPAPPPGAAYSCCGIPEEDSGEGQGKEKEQVGEGGTGGGEFTQCRKVYHAYCMGFVIGDDELGSCPRHACQECGEVARHFCRFCPVSLCEDHFQHDTANIVGETAASLVRRTRNPYPRSHPGSSWRGRGGSRGRRGGRGGRGGHGGRGSASPSDHARAASHTAGASQSPDGRTGAPPMETIATRRPKRAATAMSSSSSSLAGGSGDAGGSPYTLAVKRSRGEGGMGGAGVGVEGGGDMGGLAENEFVCMACKKTARQAVRQYGLMGALETGGIVLPYGESDASGDESESEMWALPPLPVGVALPSSKTEPEEKHVAPADDPATVEEEEGNPALAVAPPVAEAAATVPPISPSNLGDGALGGGGGGGAEGVQEAQQGGLEEMQVDGTTVAERNNGDGSGDRSVPAGEAPGSSRDVGGGGGDSSGVSQNSVGGGLGGAGRGAAQEQAAAAAAIGAAAEKYWALWQTPDEPQQQQQQQEQQRK